MYLIDINSIEYELEFVPKLFYNRKWYDLQDHHHNRKNHHKHQLHVQHPASYASTRNYFYNTNSSSIFPTMTMPNFNCSNPTYPCSYIPYVIVTQYGILIFLFVTIYSVCMAYKSRSRRSAKISTIST